ncbi:MAG: BLUF domain-containing protein [Alphaproteobacteria bacterium]|nr:BLUF domain-containing protein [Alphaproteobacteria bacterium]
MIQLIYVSASTGRLPDGEIAGFLAANRQRNKARGITGIVVHHEGSFLQVIEGKGDVVSALFDTIRNDPRHDAVALLSRKSIAHREFGDSSMAFVDTAGKAGDLDGFVDFEKDLADMTLGESQARKLLGMFLKGRWHQHLMS